MPFSASVNLGTVGDDITSVKLYTCIDSGCTNCVELSGYTEVLVSSFPISVSNIPEGTINIKVESIGRCNVVQCIPIIGIPTAIPTNTPTETPIPSSTPTPTPTSTVPPDTATPTPTSTVPPDTATPTPTSTVPPDTATPTPTPTSTPTIGPTDVPLQSYVVVGPYDTIQNACIAGNTTGGVLGTYTVTNNNVAVGETVYNAPFFETPSPVSGAPGWYAIGASFIGIYSAIRLDENGVIQELGGFCFS